MKRKEGKKITRTDEDVSYIDNLRSLTELIIEILMSGEVSTGQRGAKVVKNTIVEQAEKFKSILSYEKCKPELIHTAFQAFFDDNKANLMNTKKSTSWLYNDSFSIILGKGSRAQKMGYVLPLSAAFNKANKHRVRIDNDTYDNVNDKVEEQGSYLYQYFDLLLSKLYTVLIDSIGKSSIHAPELNKLQKYFKSKTTLKDNPHEVLTEKMTDKDAMKSMFNNVVGNVDIKDKVTALVKKAEAVNKSDDIFDEGDAIIDIMYPMISESMKGAKKEVVPKDNSSEDDSSD